MSWHDSKLCTCGCVLVVVQAFVFRNGFAWVSLRFGSTTTSFSVGWIFWSPHIAWLILNLWASCLATLTFALGVQYFNYLNHLITSMLLSWIVQCLGYFILWTLIRFQSITQLSPASRCQNEWPPNSISCEFLERGLTCL